jgi:hypothetical protein
MYPVLLAVAVGTACWPCTPAGAPEMLFMSDFLKALSVWCPNSNSRSQSWFECVRIVDVRVHVSGAQHRL